jgi:hypothetical protein
MVSVLRAGCVLRATAQGGQTRKVADLLGCSGCSACTGYPKTPGRELLATYAFYRADALVFSELLSPRSFPTLSTLSTLSRVGFMRVSAKPLTLSITHFTQSTLSSSAGMTTLWENSDMTDNFELQRLRDVLTLRRRGLLDRMATDTSDVLEPAYVAMLAATHIALAAIDAELAESITAGDAP